MTDIGSKCTRHVNARASFVCDRCAKPFCPECRCELLSGHICCTECAVDTAGENGGEFGAHHDAGIPDVQRPTKKRRRGMLLALVLLASLPILVAELVFLHQSKAGGKSPNAESQRVMSDTLVLVTELNRYKTEVGSYPDRLDMLVPSHWDPGDTAELESYEYRRIGSNRFALRPRLTGDWEEDAGIVLALDLIPLSFGEGSSIDVFLMPGRQSRASVSTGNGS